MDRGSKDEFPSASGVSRCMACVVAYDPDAGFEERVTLIADQVDELFIVNNFTAGTVHTAAGVVLENGNRGGIAGALNMAVAHARSRGSRFLALFDHDSVVPDGMIRKLVATAEATRGWIVGPAYNNSATGKAGRFVLDDNGRPVSRWIAGDEGVRPAYFVITSGTVLDLHSIPLDATYSEYLGLDMVDIDFCLSVRARGGKVYLDTSTRMSHGIGNKPAGSSRYAPPSYSMERHAGIIRNRVRTWRKWGRAFPRFIALDLMVTAADFARNILLMPDRLAYGRAYLRAFMKELLVGR